MKYISKFNNFINEEFVGREVQGALGDLFRSFSQPFKDLPNDIQRNFSDENPASIKNILLSSLTKSIDSAQKSIRSSSITSVNDVLSIIDNFKTFIIDLSNGIGKDFTTAIKDNSKSVGANEIAKLILLGNKSIKWKGIIGLLDDENYKFSSKKYKDGINAAIKDKTTDDQIKIAKEKSSSFFDLFQKDFSMQINRDLTEETLDNIYNKNVNSSGDNKIVGTIKINWGVELSFCKMDAAKNSKFVEEHFAQMYPDHYVVIKSSSEKIREKFVFKFSKIEVGKKCKLTDIKNNGTDLDNYETGIIKTIFVDNKQVKSFDSKNDNKDVKDHLTSNLKDIAAKSPTDINKVNSFVDFLKNGDEKKISEIENIINND